MLVRFNSDAGLITMFGDVAVTLLKMMGQTGVLPGAIRPEDIPAALERLKQEVAAQPAAPPAGGSRDDGEPRVGIRQRAFPLIELLERAAKRGCYVTWEEQR
jgi:hypothetical protein